MVGKEWYSERRDAEWARRRGAWRKFMDGLQARADGRPDNSGWKMPYSELGKKFLAEFPFQTEDRCEALKSVLEKNLHVGADMANKGKLTSACLKLVEARGDIYVIKWVQGP